MAETKIILEDIPMGLAEISSFPDSAPVQDITQKVWQQAYRDVINFASFEAEGINLDDTTLVLADNTPDSSGNYDDVIGFVSDYDQSISVAIRYGNDDMPTVEWLSREVPGITIEFYKTPFAGTVIFGSYQTSWTLSDVQDLKVSIPNTGHGVATGVILIFALTPGTKEFVKIKSMDFGISRDLTDFKGAVNVYHEIDPTTLDLPSSSCDFDLYTDNPPEEGQKLRVYHNDRLEGMFYASKVKRNAATLYSVECKGYIEALDELEVFSADTTKTNESIATIRQNMYNSSKRDCFTYNNASIGTKLISGMIPQNTTQRQFLSYICTALNMFLKSQGTDVPILTELPTSVSSPKSYIGSAIIKDYADTEFKGNYSSVQYTEYEASSAVTATNSDAKPYNNLGIKVVKDRQLKESSNSRLRTPTYIAQNICRWVNENEVVANVYIEDDNKDVGDVVTIQTPFDGDFTGIIVSEQISLTTVKLAELKIRKMATVQ